LLLCSAQNTNPRLDITLMLLVVLVLDAVWGFRVKQHGAFSLACP
jgi:hypothetical protein